ncbi:MAG TPA: hypothetical protein VKB53_13925 [Gammaproteobacteria bacterium]|nr:hypothetical protein [Gammaproteobacteria bacterium]
MSCLEQTLLIEGVSMSRDIIPDRFGGMVMQSILQRVRSARKRVVGPYKRAQACVSTLE